MTEAVIHDFEAVKIQKEYREAALGMTLRAGHGQFQMVEEERPIRQSGQGIMKCVVK